MVQQHQSSNYLTIILITATPSSLQRRTQQQRQHTISFVLEHEAEHRAESLGVLHFPASAKTGWNVQELQSRLLDKHDYNLESNVDGSGSGSIHERHDQEEGNVSSPRIGDKFDKYYAGETSKEEEVSKHRRRK